MEFLGQDLLPGEYICPKCCGQGQIDKPEKILIRREFIIVTAKTISQYGETCSMCCGGCKLTWTEYARGKIDDTRGILGGWGRTETIFYIGFEWTSFFMTPLMKNIYTGIQKQKRRRTRGVTL